MEKSKSIVSFIGIGFGAIALLLAIIHFWAGPFSPKPTLEQIVAEKVVSIKQVTMSALRGEEIISTQFRSKGFMDIDEIFMTVTATLGGIAIVLGVIGFAKKEPLRIAGGAVALGIGTIAFQFATVALGAIVLMIFIVVVLSQIGIV